MRPEIGVAMIGAGFVAKPHSWAISKADALGSPVVFRPRLIVDEDPSLAEAAVETLHWQESGRDWRQVLERPDIDLVAILTPNFAHEDIAVAAAEAGKSVLCEKPLASTAAAARRMEQAVDASSVTSVVAFAYRSWPPMRLARQLIRDGAIGEVTASNVWFRHSYALDPSLPLSWRFRSELAGAGALGDIGSHALDLSRYLVGEISSLFARSRTLTKVRPLMDGSGTGPVDVDDATDVLIDFEGGIPGRIYVDWACTGATTDIGFEIRGTEGALTFSWAQPMTLYYLNSNDPNRTQGFRAIECRGPHDGYNLFWSVGGHHLGWSDAFALLWHEIGSVLAGTPSDWLAGFVDGRRTAELVDAAKVSNLERAWVEARAID